MKITKEALRQVIKEELDEVLNEYEDKGPEALDALITKLVPKKSCLKMPEASIRSPT